MTVVFVYVRSLAELSLCLKNTKMIYVCMPVSVCV